ncbi:MAG: energy transducer TonB [Candidatus Neomarinimicrobiota bacterium]
MVTPEPATLPNRVAQQMVAGGQAAYFPRLVRIMGANSANRVRVIIICLLLTLDLTFFLFPKFEQDQPQIFTGSLEPLIENLDIPATHQFAAPPPPARPMIPIESDLEDYPEDITIPAMTLDEYKDWEAPPESGPRIKFIAYDEAPAPIGGYAAIGRAITYPQMAREAGVEGTVIIQIFVNRRGFVDDVIVLKGIPLTGLDEAAVKGIKKVRFEPARQRDRKVGVWVSVAVIFKLHSGVAIG